MSNLILTHHRQHLHQLHQSLHQYHPRLHHRHRQRLGILEGSSEVVAVVVEDLVLYYWVWEQLLLYFQLCRHLLQKLMYIILK